MKLCVLQWGTNAGYFDSNTFEMADMARDFRGDASCWFVTTLVDIE